MSIQQRVQAIFNRLESFHGPHSSVDVQHLRQNLATDLDPTILGWNTYLRKFYSTVTTLEQLHQKDPTTNAVIRGPRPAPVPVPDPIITNDPTVDTPRYKKYHDDVKAAEAKVLADYPNGGPPLNFKPSDTELKGYLLRWAKASSIQPINKVHSDSLENVSWNYSDIYNKLKIVAEDMEDKGPRHGNSSHQTSSGPQHHSSNSHNNSSSSNDPSVRNIKQNEHNKKCSNCGGAHNSWECPVTTCHFPGCNAGKFDSAAKRLAHFTEVHRSQHRNNHSGRGPGGRTSGGRGR